MEVMERMLPYAKKNVQLAVYDMLDQMEAEYGDGEAKDVIAEANIYGNVSKFSITVKENLLTLP